MAIWIHEPNLVILEMPKTGTTWVRGALAAAGVEHSFLEPYGKSCPRHSPAWCYSIPDRARVGVILRDPADWLESYWRCHVNARMEAWREDTLYLHQRFFGPPVGDWDSFLRECGKFVVTYFKAFLEGADFVVHHPWLSTDLPVKVCSSRCGQWNGYGHGTQMTMTDHPRENVTDKMANPVPRPDWPGREAFTTDCMFHIRRFIRHED